MEQMIAAAYNVHYSSLHPDASDIECSTLSTPSPADVEEQEVSTPLERSR
jgi:hypothetical protein